MSIVSILLYIELYVLISAVLLSKTRIKIDNPCFLFWLLYTVFLGIGPIVCSLYRYTPSRWCNPYLFILFPLALFVAGVYFSCRRNSHKAADLGNRKKTPRTKPFSRKTMLLIFYCIGVVAGLVYIAKTGLNVFSDSFNDDRISNQAGMGPFLYLNGMLVLVLPMLFELVQKRAMSKSAFASLFIIALGTFILRGSRGLCAISIMMIIIQYALKKEIKASSLFGIIILGVLGLAFVSQLRGSLGGGADFGSYLVNFFAVSFENLARVVQAIPETLQYQYGGTFFMNLAILMPGPNIDFTLWLKESLHLQYSGGGMTPTLIGDLYLNFCYFGVYLGMFIMGIILAKLNGLMHKTDNNRVYYIYLSLTLCLCITGGLSGSSLTLLMNSIAYIVIVTMSSSVVRSKTSVQKD